jgi:hypothetical protein
VGGGELGAGGFQGGGEAGPVGVGAGAGFDGVDHGRAQQLVDREQRPGFLFQSGAITRAQDVPGKHGVAQGEVGGFDLPSLVVEPDQRFGG